MSENFGCSCKTSSSRQIINMLSNLTSERAETKHLLNYLTEKNRNHSSLSNTDSRRKSNCICCPKENVSPLQRLRKENKKLKCKRTKMNQKFNDYSTYDAKKVLECEMANCSNLQQKLKNTYQSSSDSECEYNCEMMNMLKMQLYMTNCNRTQLSYMNTKLKNDFNSLDCLCAELQSNLMKQRLNKSDNVKRLSKRTKTAADEDCACKETQTKKRKVVSECESNLYVIARKLSQALKDSEPCGECSKLPTDLTDAFRCIKDLSDLVESRKASKPTNSTNCICN